MPDRTGNKVHLIYLPFLTNLHRTRQYSWDSAFLAVLYRELCRSTDAKEKTMGGCVSLIATFYVTTKNYSYEILTILIKKWHHFTL